MKLIDIVLLLALLAVIFLAIRKMLQRGRNGCCASGCSGDCSCCNSKPTDKEN